MLPGSARTASQMNNRPRVVKTYVERLQEMKQSSAPRHMMRTVTMQREFDRTHLGFVAFLLIC